MTGPTLMAFGEISDSSRRHVFVPFVELGRRDAAAQDDANDADADVVVVEGGCRRSKFIKFHFIYSIFIR